MINKISDNKKFWLVTIIYLGVFWILPFLGIFSLVDIIEKIVRYIGIVHTGINAFFIYFLIFIPIIIILSGFIIRKLKIKYKKTLFVLMYILLPYLTIFSYFLYALTHIGTLSF